MTRRTETALMLAWTVAVVLSLSGCGTAPELATVVSVHCEQRVGESDCRTVVETEDRARYVRHGNWGSEGDTVLVLRKHQGWRSP